MNIIKQVIVLTSVFLVAPAVAVADEKDCLLTGTVVHEGSDRTLVKIHSVSKYDDDARCQVRRDRKVEFKLPADTRVNQAPSGSEVRYRYRTDDDGASDAELISVGA